MKRQYVCIDPACNLARATAAIAAFYTLRLRFAAGKTRLSLSWRQLHVGSAGQGATQQQQQQQVTGSVAPTATSSGTWMHLPSASNPTHQPRMNRDRDCKHQQAHQARTKSAARPPSPPEPHTQAWGSATGPLLLPLSLSAAHALVHSQRTAASA